MVSPSFFLASNLHDFGGFTLNHWFRMVPQAHANYQKDTSKTIMQAGSMSQTSIEQHMLNNFPRTRLRPATTSLCSFMAVSRPDSLILKSG